MEDASTSRVKNARFRSYVKSRKAEIWGRLKETAKNSKNMESIARLACFFQEVSQDIHIGLEDGEIDQSELSCVPELIFPACERKLLHLVLKPIFIAHFVHFRMNSIKHNRNFDNHRVSDRYRSEEDFTQHTQYLVIFRTLLAMLQQGIMHIENHITYTIGILARELALGYVDREMRLNENELKCTFFQEMLVEIQSWCSLLNLEQEIFQKPMCVAIQKDVIKILSKDIYRLVIVDFPEKYRSIFTLRYCMKNTNNFGRDELTKRLIEEITSKLLLASVDTKVILNAYASCVESLRELDTTCVVMHKVCQTMKEYLKKRTDTVQQIISYITSDKKDELEKDMSNTKRSAMMDEDELKGVNDEFLPENMDVTGWHEWEPYPNDANFSDGSQRRQGVDVFNMLVSVYGSKEMFVKEYRSLLAERLSNSEKKDPNFEKRYLDLLKLRFQYSELQHCDVMLRDMEQSQRVDEKVLTLSTLPISACVISSHYWPKIEPDKGEAPLPAPIDDAMKAYAEKFEEVRSRRKLKWLRGIGCVEIEMELEGVRIERIVPNVYALVLYLFLEKDSWNAAEVATNLGITGAIAKRRLEWWTKQGLLVASIAAGSTSEVWTLTKNPAGMAANRAKLPEAIDEDELALDDATDMVESLEQYWGYTQNYIANHANNGEVKAERMHRVYRMFGSPTSAGPTLDHVNTFLQRKVQLGLLTYSNGLFRVVPKT